VDSTVLSPAETVLAAVQADPRAAKRAAQQIIETATDPRERAVAMWALGFAHRELSDLEAAESLMRQAIGGAEDLDDETLAARIMTSLALVVMNRGTPASALEMIGRPIAVLTGADRARALMQRGAIQYRLANFDAARRDHLDAIADLQSAEDWVALARLHVNLGSIQSYLRDFDAAELSLAEAIDLSERNGQALLAGYAHHNQGHLRALRGDVPGALRSFDIAMDRYDELGSPSDQVATLMADRARTLADAGLKSEAVEAVDVAYDLVRRGVNEAEAADIALLTAAIRLEAGDPERAVEPAAWARDTYSQQGRDGWIPLAELLLLRSRIHEPDATRAAESRRLASDLDRLGWTEEAQSALIFAADRHVACADMTSAIDALDAAARLDGMTLRSRTAHWLAMGRRHALVDDLDAARAAVDAGLSLISANRSAIGAVELMSRSIESGAELADLGVEVEVRLDHPRGVIDVLRHARWADRAVGPTPEHDRVLAELLIELRQTVNDVRTTDQLGSDRVELRHRQADLERRIRDRARVAPGSGRSRPDEAGPAIADGEVDRIVAVSITDDELVEVVASGSTQEIRRVPLGQPIGRLLESIEFALHRLNRVGASTASRQVASVMLDEASAELDAILVPAELRTSTRPLVVTPIDALHGLAWRTLPSLRHRAITVSGSVGAPPPVRPVGGLLLIAGPGLDHADAEIGTISGAVAGSVAIASGDASINAVIEQISQADIVHIACHGVFRTDNPLFSSLHLADGDLTIFELERCTRLPHTMVLSACNAGQSAVLRGGALLGFANALMQLGLATVIAPLTPVNDERSVDSMAGLHRRLRGGDDAARALAAVSTGRDGVLNPTAAAFSCFGV